MNYSIKLPSRKIPTEPIMLVSLQLAAGEDVLVTDDWGRKYNRGSISVTGEEFKGHIDKWVYLHALAFDETLTLYAHQGNGGGAGDFVIEAATQDLPVDKELIDYENIGKAIYGDESEAEVSYDKMYENYLKQPDNVHSAIKNYFLAVDLGYNQRLRYVNVSYWQIVLLVSAMEALLPPPTFCDGTCSTCEEGVHHPTSQTGTDWNKILFKKIKNKATSKQYREILEEARFRIRNDAVHNGLWPGAGEMIAALMPSTDGIKHYVETEALEGYKHDKMSLEVFVHLLRQICRYLILDQIIQQGSFPLLKGFDVHTVTIRRSSYG